jgi:hypothetical protein
MANPPNPNFLPGEYPLFTNFYNKDVKNAFMSSTFATDSNTIDLNFFKMMKEYPPKIDNTIVTYDVDPNNALTVQKIRCIYPTNPNAPQTHILAYRANMDSGEFKFRSLVDTSNNNNTNNNTNQQCMTQPSQPYSDSYMPGCMSVCTRIESTPTAPNNYSCNYGGGNGGGDNGPKAIMYIPRGGWMHAAINKQSLLQSLSNSPSASDIIDTREPLVNKSINVTTASGGPVYIANNNSTSDLSTWTRLQDLCQ